MPKKSVVKYNRLTDEIDNRLLAHIKKIELDNKGVVITSSVVSEYVRNADYRFRRMKKMQLEKSIDRVLKTLKKQRLEEQSASSVAAQIDDEQIEDGSPSDNSDITNEEEDSDFAQLEDVRLMEVKDTNSMNNSITRLWSQRLAQSSDSPQLEVDSTPKDADTSEIISDSPANPYALRTPSKTAIVTKDDVMPEKRLPKNKRKITQESESFIDAKKLKARSSSVPRARLSDLGGVDACIEEVLELIVMPLAHPEIYLHTGVQPPRGILLHGPSGCGKTLLAHAIAGELGVPFVNISAPSIVSGMSGESEKKVREVFDEAKGLAPCLIFIDEIDAITPKRETAQREMERRIVAQLLTCMDDLSWDKTDNKPVLIIGATNRPDSLDPALRRAGRFDREISMGVPDEEAREKILRVIASKLRLSGDFDFKSLARMTPGYVGADLNALTAAAGVIAVKRIFQQFGNDITSTQKTDDDTDAMITDEGDILTLQQPPTPTTTMLTSHAEPLVLSIPSISLEFSNRSPTEQLRSISAFLRNHPEPLTPVELEPLSITSDDFIQALSKVQPSSKREGFATVPDVAWSDIGALKFIREELRMAIVEPIKHPEFFQRVGITAPSGVLLWGPPGCGKTLLAKAVANESHTSFISVKGPELLNKYVGESERGVRQVFARARASSPCVIFFDELDALCPRRDDSKSESSARVVNTLLTELDGLENRKQVYVIAATNRPDIIDPAMMRPGRLDKLLYVELPTAPERQEILRTLTAKTPLAADIDFKKVAEDQRCEGFSGADLASLVREAAVVALRETFYAKDSMTSISPNEIFVTAENFEAAFAKVAPSVSKQDKKKYDTLRVKFGCATESKVAGRDNPI
ncbi:4390_t:CDS:10 [Paraglomus brasilianum]|uniref:Peroxisomal ATPase PEX1 n=1 Tax=Paraglomus brasilianum TaxID=144538 RepID=A0A9N8WUV9_9GLOM|nr:4390_t:CDS:10 [Paraglomus brasilianum]